MRHAVLSVIIGLALVSCAPTAESTPPSNLRTRAADLYREALARHREAARTNDRAGYEAAIRGYERFLATNPSDAAAYEAHKFDGEARYAIADWSGAAEQYRRALAIDGHGKDSAELAYANVLATRYAQHLRDGDADPGCDDDIAETPRHDEELPANAKLLVGAYDLFLALGDANDPMQPSIRFMKARILYSCAHFTEAEPIFATIAHDYAESPEAPPSAVLLLDALLQEGRRERALEVADELERTLLGSDPSVAEALRELRKATRKRKPS